MEHRSRVPGVSLVPNKGRASQTAKALEGLSDLSLLIVGLGSVGYRHLKNLLRLGVKNLTVLRTGKGRRALPEDPSPALEATMAEALAGQPTAVVVSNPTALHMGTALAAAEAGCHLFIEKPVAHSWSDVSELCTRVAARDLVAVTGFQFRFHPLLRTAKQWLELGQLGRIISCRARYGEYLPGWHPGEDYRNGYSARVGLGGGPVLTLSHPFDYLRWLLGDVWSVGGVTAKLSLLEIDTEDTAQALLRFCSGAIGTVELDYVQHPYEHSLQIVGEAATLKLDFKENILDFIPADGDKGVHVVAPKGFERNDMFVEEMRNFLAAVLGQEAPVCTLEDGLRALEISLAVHRSSAERREIDVGIPI